MILETRTVLQYFRTKKFRKHADMVMEDGLLLEVVLCIITAVDTCA